MRSLFSLALLICLLTGATAVAQPSATTADVVTLRQLGAIGDGKTDDRAAIEAALNSAKGPIDGEGLTYAVHGNIVVRVATDFRNAKLVQTMDAADTAKFVPSEGELTLDPPTALRSTVKGFPVMHPEGVGLYSGDPIPTEAELATLMPSIQLVTLSICGNDGQLIPVKLEKITIDRGDNPQSGGRNDGRGLVISHASPVVVRDVEITGDGKGAGLNLSDSKQVLFERLNIHDMNWAPYAGDTVLDELTAAEVRDVIGWNNFPIYEYRDALKRFARVRIQEQLVGMFVYTSEDVQIIDSRVERLQVKIGDELYPLQSDGITVNRIKGLAIKNCQISRVWEGIDFTGAAGQDFVFENCTVSDTLAYSIKLAHPKQNGKLINCTAIRGGHAGFAMEAEAENIELINCQALETAGNKDWLLPDNLYDVPLSAFRIAGKNIRIENCAAINKEHPDAIDYGLWCESDPVANDIKVVNFTSIGAKIKPLEGITDSAPSAAADVVTLRQLGAVGDGKTDDRAAIEAALNNAKGPIDGEGLTYAVHGNIEVRVATDFRNAKLVQTMEAVDTAKFITAQGELTLDPPTAPRSKVKGLDVIPAPGVGLYSGDPIPTEAELAKLMPSIKLVTLAIRGEVGRLIPVKLEKITIDRGDNPRCGGFSDGRALLIACASPVEVRDVEITGDGKGVGLRLEDSKQVLLERLNIHDMNWAPYDGDTVLDQLTAAEVRDDFGWNNFPIYEFRDGLNRFARVRIREQLVGMHVVTSDDVQIIDSRVERLQVKIGDELYPLQSDGITVNRITGLVIKNCQISKVWEGIDFTGGGGQDFVFENCTVTDTLGWAFKLAHPKKNGKMINCTAIRGGLAGFNIEPESENIELINCQALETGGNQYWLRPDGTNEIRLTGFRVEGKRIRVENCSAINKEHAGAIEYGLLCESDPVANDIKVVNFSSVGAKLKPMEGITDSAPAAK